MTSTLPLLAAAWLCLLVIGSCCSKQRVPMSTMCPKKCKSRKCFSRCARSTVLAWSQSAVPSGITHNETLQRFFGLVMPDLPSGAPGVTIRVEPAGTFPGGQMAAEYYTVFTNPIGPSNLLVPLNFTMRRFTSDWPVASATIDYTSRSTLNGRIANLTIEQWFRFDSATNRVISGDFNILRFGAFLADLKLFDPFVANPALTALFMIAPVCKTSADYCSTVPSLVQYNSTKSCSDFLSSIPIFRPDEIGSNTLLCRYIHIAMLPTAPEVHCPHIGPSGGGACTDTTYNDYFTSTPFKEDVFVTNKQ